MFSNGKRILIPKTKNKEFDTMFFDVNKIKDKLSTLNMIIGGRGIGKTFSSKRYVIDNFLTTGSQFMWVRRTKAQLEPSLLFADIVNFYDFKMEYVLGDSQQLTTLYINDKICGYLASVSTGYNLKSQSFENVSTIVYDEFIKTENERAIKKEPFLFLEMVESIIRLRDDLLILMLANSTNLNNEYFRYFNICLDDVVDNNEIIQITDSLNVLKLKDNQEFIDKKLSTKFGQLIRNTNYYDYAVKNDWSDNLVNTLYIDKNLNAFNKNDFSICIGNTFIYFHEMNTYKCKLYVSSHLMPSNNCYTTVLSFASKSVQYTDGSKILEKLSTYYPLFKNFTVKFDTINTYYKSINLFGIVD